MRQAGSRGCVWALLLRVAMLAVHCGSRRVGHDEVAARKLIAQRDFDGAIGLLERGGRARDRPLLRACAAMRAASSRRDAVLVLERAHSKGDQEVAVELSRMVMQMHSDSDQDTPSVAMKCASVLRDAWKLEEMHSVLERKIRLTRGMPATALRIPREAHKLEHDIEQFNYLVSLGHQTHLRRSVIPAYEFVLEALRRKTPLKQWNLAQEHQLALARTLEKTIHVGNAPRVAEGALNPQNDWRAVEEAYLSASPHVVSVDAFLSPQALRSLRHFCLESTFWHHVKSRYLGAYSYDGFSAPLLWQIGEEMPVYMPRIFGNLTLQHWWAYKYGRTVKGIDVHGDDAAVNVNLWLTPDSSHLDNEGGLVVYTKEAPEEWKFSDMNTKSDVPNARAYEFLRESGMANVTIPYQENRATLFISTLFHKTDRMMFRKGYLHRRINVTFLYGRRGEKVALQKVIPHVPQG